MSTRAKKIMADSRRTAPAKAKMTTTRLRVMEIKKIVITAKKNITQGKKKATKGKKKATKGKKKITQGRKKVTPAEKKQTERVKKAMSLRKKATHAKTEVTVLKTMAVPITKKARGVKENCIQQVQSNTTTGNEVKSGEPYETIGRSTSTARLAYTAEKAAANEKVETRQTFTTRTRATASMFPAKPEVSILKEHTLLPSQDFDFDPEQRTIYTVFKNKPTHTSKNAAGSTSTTENVTATKKISSNSTITTGDVQTTDSPVIFAACTTAIETKGESPSPISQNSLNNSELDSHKVIGGMPENLVSTDDIDDGTSGLDWRAENNRTASPIPSTSTAALASLTPFIPYLTTHPSCCINVNPMLWRPNDVDAFLRINVSDDYSAAFLDNEVDGQILLALNIDQIIILTKMKVGPALKIMSKINQLKRFLDICEARATFGINY